MQNMTSVHTNLPPLLSSSSPFCSSCSFSSSCSLYITSVSYYTTKEAKLQVCLGPGYNGSVRALDIRN